MDHLEPYFDAPRQFYLDSQRLIRSCTKPTREEYISMTQAVAIGFLVMGFIGYIVKLVHIPINNVIVGA
ncbi:protein translocase SEC61 complex gamma subunit [Fonticula alba]|uniref:Protein translocase SEC61 complex gamma subunit n=1 Tax=Fonticula alba TaxID=691883 RepID=A0A058ZFE5_FONAL|nr:protein translocase SEC61 complex gamma subunit [Fonticula alba]KCV73074.1 protein translocase SEC61 complex gamma subunit [Fonticula alba]|eukprot:XP_009492775.1 protein translocase SEC61 complex gamma subunit [Fonticula alba]